MSDVEKVANWRCFHCGEVFTDAASAGEHFGGSLMALAACQIKAEEGGLVSLLRKQELELDRFRSEDSASFREFHRLGAEHTRKVQQAEEDGYAKGLADGRAEARAALSALGGWDEAPTEEMKLAGARSLRDSIGWPNQSERAAHCYSAMTALRRPAAEGGRVMRAADYLDAVNAPPAEASGKSHLTKVYRAPKITPETKETAPQVHSEDRLAEAMAETPTTKGPAR